MESSLQSSCLLVVSFGLLACQPKVPGSYELDFEETKRAVLATAEAYPAERPRLDETLKMLRATRLTVRLLDGGKMETTTELIDRSLPTPPLRLGAWTREGTKVTLALSVDASEAMHGHEKEPDTLCSVDGKRLRCIAPLPNKLFQNYVLVRK